MPRPGRTEFTNNLPVWKVTRLTPTKLGIQCPRKLCEQKAIVARGAWLRGHPGKSRACTYCFAANRIPEELKP